MGATDSTLSPKKTWRYRGYPGNSSVTIKIGAAVGTLAYTAQAMSAALSHIETQIEASRYILSLGDDWDDEGAPGYRIETWERATGFVRATAREFMQLTGRIAPAPRISNGPDSSVDILWQLGARELLINIPDAPDTPADFYGHNGPSGSFTVQGIFPSSSPQSWLLMWLTS
jgi:hypothetical protein